MFLRLFFAFVAFGVLISALAAVVLVSRTGGERYLSTALLFALFAGIMAIAPAWVFARSCVRPFREIRAGAERISHGDYGHRVDAGPWRESRELAHSFNAMSAQLAEQIERLASERQQLRAILGGMAEGVVAVGPGQRVLFVNEAAGRMLDFDAAIDRPLYEMTRLPHVQAILDSAIRSGQPQREDIEFKKADERHLSVFVAPLVDAPGAVLVLDDTSELRRLERLRREFVANVSHELKTPLAVMKTCVETLQDGAVDDAQIRGPLLAQIAEGADRLHALILDLLSLARIESGDELLEYAAVPVSAAVRACLDRQQPRADAKLMTLETMPPPAPLDVWADDEALGQILDNLVDNAVKYTQPGGNVRVRWFGRDNDVCLSVEDNGPGIPERDLSRIFERFYRVDRARSRELGGTGLGLSIVKHLTQAMRGTVTASSKIGAGSTFVVCLPRPTHPE